MSRPLLTNSPTVALEVTALRKLRADAILSAAPWNGLQQMADGLYLRTYSPIGAAISALGLAISQTIPIFGSGVTALSSSTVTYTTAVADNGVAREGTAMWDATLPTRLTIRRKGRYLVSSHGRWKSSGAYSQVWPSWWISLNGDDTQSLGAYAQTFSPAADPGALAAPLGWSPATGGETYTSAYGILNEVTLNVGDYIETRVVALSTAAAPANVIALNTQGPFPNQNFALHTLAAVQVGEVE